MHHSSHSQVGSQCVNMTQQRPTHYERKARTECMR